MRVHVDSARCQGHTLCAMIAAEVFELDDVDGRARVIAEDVPAAQHEAASEAARSCPEQAINVMIDQLVAGRAAHGRRLEQ